MAKDLDKGQKILDELREENSKITKFITDIKMKMAQTDKKLAKAILKNDISTMELYKDIISKNN